MDYLELVAAVQPEAVRAALDAHAAELARAAGVHHHGANTSVRNATHQGHRIVVRTTYEITIDGEPFDSHLVVDNGGRVHYHGLPTRDFASTVDLVRKVIDEFPDFRTEETPAPAEPAPPGHHGHVDGGGH